mmetsp:Transcript_16689/g.33909  ORF Transcript_16689/g.33909 Transcript_16689/m.33909 type:complete len:271 (-) Transcript_16689:111-923(-)
MKSSHPVHFRSEPVCTMSDIRTSPLLSASAVSMEACISSVFSSMSGSCMPSSFSILSFSTLSLSFSGLDLIALIDLGRTVLKKKSFARLSLASADSSPRSPPAVSCCHKASRGSRLSSHKNAISGSFALGSRSFSACSTAFSTKDARKQWLLCTHCFFSSTSLIRANSSSLAAMKSQTHFLPTECSTKTSHLILGQLNFCTIFSLMCSLVTAFPVFTTSSASCARSAATSQMLFHSSPSRFSSVHNPARCITCQSTRPNEFWWSSAVRSQ